MRIRLAAAAAAVAIASAFLAGCGADTADDGPRAVTTEESQLLAIARFTNFDVGTRHVEAALSDAGFDLTITGYFDYRNQTGYVGLAEGGQRNSLLLWREHTIYAHAPVSASLVLPPPDAADGPGAEWGSAGLDPTASTLHAVLILIAELGNDRPDNPLLLQQGGAQWLRTDTVRGTSVTVFAGPTTTDAGGNAVESRLRYWVTDEGLLLRVEALLGDDWVTVDFGDAQGVTIDALSAPATATQ